MGIDLWIISFSVCLYNIYIYFVDFIGYIFCQSEFVQIKWSRSSASYFEVRDGACDIHINYMCELKKQLYLQ